LYRWFAAPRRRDLAVAAEAVSKCVLGGEVVMLAVCSTSPGTRGADWPYRFLGSPGAYVHPYVCTPAIDVASVRYLRVARSMRPTLVLSPARPRVCVDLHGRKNNRVPRTSVPPPRPRTSDAPVFEPVALRYQMPRPCKSLSLGERKLCTARSTAPLLARQSVRVVYSTSLLCR